MLGLALEAALAAHTFAVAFALGKVSGIVAGSDSGRALELVCT